MRKVYRYFFLIVLSQSLFQQNYTISGLRYWYRNRWNVDSATIIVKGTNIGVISDQNGYFSITGLKSGEYTLKFIYLGYKKTRKKSTDRNKSLLLAETPMTPEVVNLDAVTINRHETRFDRWPGDWNFAIKTTAQTISNIPSGKGDVFKAIKLSSCIETTDPFSPYISARVNDRQATLYWLDVLPYISPYHLQRQMGCLMCNY